MANGRAAVLLLLAWVTKASLAAAPTATLKELLVAEVSPVLLEVRM
jgi:hypothetical protein